MSGKTPSGEVVEEDGRAEYTRQEDGPGLPGLTRQVSPGSQLISQVQSMPKLVYLCLSTQYFYITFTSITLGALFDAYISLLSPGTDKNEAVGFVESFRGIATLVMAFPLGVAGDRFAKFLVLRTNAVFGLACVVVLAYGIRQDSLPLVIAGCVGFSIHNQALYTILPTVVAEGTTRGEQRTKAISMGQTANSLGNASGPLVQLAELQLATDGAWNTTELHSVLAMGFVPFLAYIGSLFRLTQEHKRVEVEQEASPVDAAAAEHQATKKEWAIATMLEVSNLMTAIGSGMTFKYWPLFFKNDFGFSPAQVCMQQLAIWFGIALGSSYLNPFVLRIFKGRLLAANVLHFAGTGSLFLISISSLGVWIECPLVILRNTLMNSGGPLIQAKVMDLVPQQHRGKWSGIFSLRRMTWSGSAFIGGVLSDSHDYRYAFFITACVHTVAGLGLLATNLLESHWQRSEQRLLQSAS